MGKYKRLFIYKRDNALIQTQYLSVTLTIRYNTSVYLSVVMAILYNIKGTDARSLWEPKVPGQALWQALDKHNPASYPISVSLDFLQAEDGEPLELEDGTPMYLE